MDRNILKELHEDLRKLIIDKYYIKKGLSLSKITIYHDKTIIEYNILDDKGEYVDSEEIVFSNNNWRVK